MSYTIVYYIWQKAVMLKSNLPDILLSNYKRDIEFNEQNLCLQVIKSFVAKCLHLASENGMTSIAFPALGTGNLGYEHKYVATAMFETVRSFIEGSLYTSVKEIVFNAFDPKSQQVDVCYLM